MIFKYIHWVPWKGRWKQKYPWSIYLNSIDDGLPWQNWFFSCIYSASIVGEWRLPSHRHLSPHKTSAIPEWEECNLDAYWSLTRYTRARDGEEWQHFSVKVMQNVAIATRHLARIEFRRWFFIPEEASILRNNINKFCFAFSRSSIVILKLVSSILVRSAFDKSIIFHNSDWPILKSLYQCSSGHKSWSKIIFWK